MGAYGHNKSEEVDADLEEVKKIAQEATKSKASEQFRRGYKLGVKYRKETTKSYMNPQDRESLFVIYPNDKVAAEEILRNPNYAPDSNATFKGYAMAVANKLMGHDRSMEANYLGARVYEKIGQGGRPSVRGKLLAKFKELSTKAPQYVHQYSGKVEDFLVHNPKKKGKLEEIAKTSAIISFIGSLFFLVTRITGNAIGGMNSNSSSIMTIILFFIGLIGLSVYVRERK